MARTVFSIKNKRVKEWGLALLLALIFSLLVNTFVVQLFMITSTKMEKTILAGDFVIVNKVSYGARLPISVLSAPFVSSVYSSLIQLPYVRVSALTHINRNDLIAFNQPSRLNVPIDKKEPVVKRCVALPGDTICIIDKHVFVNSELSKNSPLTQFNYRLVTDGTVVDQMFLDKYDINDGGMVSEIGIYDFPLDESVIEHIKAEEGVRYIRELKNLQNERDNAIFPIKNTTSFNRDNFGPLVVPFKGQEVDLDVKTISLYRDIIEEYEGNKLFIKDNKVFVNDIESAIYTIKYNYFFMLDDNRDNANDSRYWGVLPESYIVGRVSFVLFSFDKNRGKVRWNRIFKSI